MKSASFVFSLCALVGASGCIVIPVGDLLKGPGLTEQVLVQGGGFWSQEKIAIIDIDGMISGEDSPSVFVPGENTVSETKARFNMARRDPDVKAVVLRIASPGGEVTACDVLHHELQRFKRQTQIPVVASIGDQGTSGGYYLAVGADTIFANPTAIVGSIGVILEHFDLSGLLAKIGVEAAPIKSADKKDLSSPFRRMSEEEAKILQKLVDDMYSRFVDVVDAGRPSLSREEVLQLADGRVVSGVEAANLKLVDRAGYLTDAIEEAQKRAGIESPTVVRYTRAARGGANIYTESLVPSPAAKEISMSFKTSVDGSPKLYYLWRPGY